MTELDTRWAGLMEFVGMDKAARSKMRVWKMQEWTNQHSAAMVDIIEEVNTEFSCPVF